MTIDAQVTVMIHTGDHQSALRFVHFLTPAHPDERGSHDTHGLPLDHLGGAALAIETGSHFAIGPNEFASGPNSAFTLRAQKELRTKSRPDAQDQRNPVVA